MSRPAIRIENLGKRYLVDHERKGRGGYRTLRESISDTVAGLGARGWRLGKRILASSPQPLAPSPQPLAPSSSPQPLASSPSPTREEFWALKDVSFEVQPGEVVGIIGRNGAGKSTLLKILSQITKPTTGRVELNGRVGSLLEVGTGFHPELTGRENIYLNGSILGMKKTEIDRKFDEIVDFAEIEQFLDTPVKRYSSGMYTRLAFAVAAHLEPEILVIDEVLAVGDADFQRKCLGKMKDVAKQGRTVLFVSHNMDAISTLTERCFLFRHGRCATEGITTNVLNSYFHDNGTVGSYVASPSLDIPKITRVEVITSEPGSVQLNGSSLRIAVEVSTPRPVARACLSIQIVDSMMRPIIHMWTYDSDRPMCRTPGTDRLECVIPKVRLFIGQYHLRLFLSEPPGGKFFDQLDGLCSFEVKMGCQRLWPWRQGDCTYLEDADWIVSRVRA